MKVGVIGGSGFIGSHLVDKLIDANHEVTVFDIMSPHRKDVRHVIMDILDPTRTTLALAGGYDCIYLLAAVANVNDVFQIPVESAHVNIMAVAHVLEAARRTGAKRVILASTTWVYGMAESQAVDEDTPLTLSRAGHVYTASKVSAELLCHAYRDLYKVNTTILRYGIPYGPRARMGTALATFVSRAIARKPITIDGDGSQWRTFVYVEDLALGNVAALEERAANQTYNLDGSEQVSIRQVAEMVAKVFPETVIEYREARPGDYKPKLVSCNKALRDLKWQATTNFEQGGARYIEWVRMSK